MTTMTTTPIVVDVASLPTWAQYYGANLVRLDHGTADLADQLSRSMAPGRSPLSLSTKVALWPNGDLTRLQCGAIVNAANRHLKSGGGICGAIFGAAGREALRQACDQLGGCPTGQARITPGFALPAQHIIHAVGPIGADQEALRLTYESVLCTMRDNGIRSIGLCCISTGIYGFPNDLAAVIALATTRNWLCTDDNAQAVDRIVFSTFLPKDTRIYEALMPIAFPCPDGDQACLV